MMSFDRLLRATGAIALRSVALAASGTASTGALSEAPQVNVAAVDAAVAPYVGTQVPGLSLAVGYHGRVIFAKERVRDDGRCAGNWSLVLMPMPMPCGGELATAGTKELRAAPILRPLRRQ